MESKSIVIGVITRLFIGAAIGLALTPKVDTSEFEDEINQLRQQVDILEASVEAKDSHIDELEEQIDQLESQVVSLQNEISDLQVSSEIFFIRVSFSRS